MNSLGVTTIVENIFKGVAETLIQFNLKWNQLRRVTTDQDKNMYKAEKQVNWTILQSL